MKGREPPRPYFKNRPQEARKRRQANLLATSKATGIQHSFGNIAGWEKIIEDYENKSAMQTAQLVSSLHFYQWLEKQTIASSFCSKIFDEVGYRYANPNRGPIAVEGSLAYGGRFNIGGSQMNQNFPTLNISGCVYLASSAECAREEAAKPIGAHKLFRLKPKTSLRVWNLREIIAGLDYPNLIDLVNASHGEKIWAYQKLPTESQILGHKLKALGGDGVLFESTKMEGHFNVGLFCDNNDAAKSILDIL